MTGGALAALALVLLGPVFHLLPHQEQRLTDRAFIWAVGSCVTLGWLAISIGLLARHRLTNPKDINPADDGSTPGARILVQQLQNTLEQTALAVGSYSVWTVLAPASWGVAPLVGAALFSLGRLLFIVGYAGGAEKRALGFALTFYPTIAILGCGIVAAFVHAGA